jgi:hypothetical protein
VVKITIVDGLLYFDRGADRERQVAIDAIKNRLLGKDLEAEEPAGDEAGDEADPGGLGRRAGWAVSGREEG